MATLVNKLESKRETVYVQSYLERNDKTVCPLITDTNDVKVSDKMLEVGLTYRVYPRGIKGFFKTAKYVGLEEVHTQELEKTCRKIEQPIQSIGKVTVTYIR